MSQHSTNGTNPGRSRSVVEQIASFSTTAAFVFVAVWLDQPLFFVAAGFAALAAVAALYARQHPREARIATWVGRAGMVVVILIALFFMILAR